MDNINYYLLMMVSINLSVHYMFNISNYKNIIAIILIILLISLILILFELFL
jgi:hypothetical protein